MFESSLIDCIRTLKQYSALNDITCPTPHTVEEITFHGVGIDSRRIVAGQIFAAFPGKYTHGLQWVNQAAENGAVAVLSDRRPALNCPLPCVCVRDLTQALTILAAAHRRCCGARRIAVTGSVGKTTTRNLTATLLRTLAPTAESPANYNNQLGVPLSLLAVRRADRFAVLELATGGPGELQSLAALASPDIAVVTRIGAAHAEAFGSLAATRKEKQAVVESLAANGLAVLNLDDPHVAPMRSATAARVVTYGRAAEADLLVLDSSAREYGCRLRMKINNPDAFPLSADSSCDERTVLVPQLGPQMEGNVAAAVAVALSCGVAWTQIEEGLREFTPSRGRSSVIQLGKTVLLDDSYNASPESFDAAFRWCQQLKEQHPQQYFLLGDMLELGPLSRSAHYELGKKAGACRPAGVSYVGEHANWFREGWIDSGASPERFSSYSTLNDLPMGATSAASDSDPANRLTIHRLIKELWSHTPKDAPLVLLKASHSIGLHKLSRALCR